MNGQTDSSLSKFNTIPKNKVLNTDSILKPFASFLKTPKPVVVMFYSPDCDHCQTELEAILNANLTEIQFVLVSNRPLFLLKPFAKKYKLSQYKNITIISDYKNEIARYYGIGSYPSMVIYNAKHEAVKRFMSSMVSTSDIKRLALGL